MANTTNIDLVKPAGTDYALVSVINSNMDKVDAEAGRERANFAAAYSDSSAYAVGDLCIYQGVLYRCTTAIGGSGEAWNASHWTQVSIAELLLSAIFMSKQNVANANADLDNGIYYATSATQNVPNGYGLLLNLKSGGSAARRFQLCFASTDMWYRFGQVNNNVLTWNGWMKVTATAV